MTLSPSLQGCATQADPARRGRDGPSWRDGHGPSAECVKHGARGRVGMSLSESAGSSLENKASFRLPGSALRNQPRWKTD
jgi:hypothetical protein